MTKEEYKDRMCKTCIYKNCNNDICEKHQDNVKIYKCIDYISIFECNKRSCRECGRCEEKKN